MYAATDNRLRLSLIIITLVLCSSLVFAVDLSSDDSSTENKDIYDRISTLVDSLQAWSECSVTDKDDDNFASEDTLNLKELFPFSEIEQIDTMGTIRITLPKYMNMLTSTLLLMHQDSSQTGDRPHWGAPVSVEDDHLLIDGLFIQCDSLAVRDTLLIERIRTELTYLRTIGLPDHLRAPEIEFENTDVTVTIRGRDMIDIPFTVDRWIWSFEQLAEGWLVYAGVLNIEKDADRANINYYVLITYPEATGHHFIEWRESAVKDHKYWRTVTIEAILTPYIRTDNLKDLFAQPDKSDREQIELKIK